MIFHTFFSLFCFNSYPSRFSIFASHFTLFLTLNQVFLVTLAAFIPPSLTGCYVSPLNFFIFIASMILFVLFGDPKYYFSHPMCLYIDNQFFIFFILDHFQTLFKISCLGYTESFLNGMIFGFLEVGLYCIWYLFNFRNLLVILGFLTR